MIKENKNDDFALSFKDIEEILGFSINHSFLKYKKELLDYGFEVSKISRKEETVTFIKKLSKNR